MSLEKAKISLQDSCPAAWFCSFEVLLPPSLPFPFPLPFPRSPLCCRLCPKHRTQKYEFKRGTDHVLMPFYFFPFALPAPRPCNASWLLKNNLNSLGLSSILHLKAQSSNLRPQTSDLILQKLESQNLRFLKTLKGGGGRHEP